MKMILTLTLALAPLVVFGQEKQEKKTVEQVMQEISDLSSKQELERIDRYVEYFRKSEQEFKKLADERTADYKDVDEALKDGDKILIEKAVSNIHSNAHVIRLHAESQQRDGEQLQNAIETAFQSDLIAKARYLELRNMVRNGITETNKEVAGEYTKLLEKAKSVVPDYFAILEMTGIPLCANGTVPQASSHQCSDGSTPKQ